VSILLLTGLPLFLGYKSKSPVFFGMYSAKLMLVNTVYILALLFSSGLFIYFSRKND
jgi:NADH:ubiquinone oxidoreductase subunit 5 (subunit L)/multisubunit Na+/H+ antiporter MnhA subunit